MSQPPAYKACCGVVADLLPYTSPVEMAQRLIDLSSTATEGFIAKTAILAELVVEHEVKKQKEEELIIINECRKVTG